MDGNRFGMLTKMAMQRHGLTDEDVRQALLGMRYIDGNPKAFFRTYDMYKDTLNAVKKTFGSYLVFNKKEEIQLESIAELEKYFNTFTMKNALFDDILSPILETTQNYRDEYISNFIIENIWKNNQNREADIKAFIKLVRNFNVSIVDFPFTRFSKVFGAVPPKNYEAMSFQNVLIDLDLKYHNYDALESSDRHAVEGALDNLVPPSNHNDNATLSRCAISACALIYENIIKDSREKNTSSVAQLKDILWKLLKGLELKVNISKKLGGYPALLAFLRNGSFNHPRVQKSRSMFKSVDKLGDILDKIKSSISFQDKLKYVRSYMNTYVSIIPKTKTDEHLKSYLDQAFTRFFVCGLQNPEIKLLQYYVSFEYRILKTMFTQLDQIKNPVGLSLVRKWLVWIHSKIAPIARDTINTALIGTISEDFRYIRPEFSKIIGAILVLGGANGPVFAREFLRSLPIDGMVQLEWAKESQDEAAKYAEQIQALIIKTHRLRIAA